MNFFDIALGIETARATLGLIVLGGVVGLVLLIKLLARIIYKMSRIAEDGASKINSIK